MSDELRIIRNLAAKSLPEYRHALTMADVETAPIQPAFAVIIERCY